VKMQPLWVVTPGKETNNLLKKKLLTRRCIIVLILNIPHPVFLKKLVVIQLLKKLPPVM